MFSTADTIVAIATPPGRSSIGVVRLSGADAHAIASRLTGRPEPFEARRAILANLATFDQAVVTYFPQPHSYTGEDVVEIAAHGSPVILNAIVAETLACGARAAEPGEFTLRAFLNGRIDLPQAEAVADLIDAVTPLQARAAFDQLNGTLTVAIGELDALLFDIIARLEASVDFPEEGYHFIEPSSLVAAIDTVLARTATLLADARRGQLLREGFQVAIVGRPNVGKSSLFNALVGTPRAIVTSIPGTTRDFVTETVAIEGLRMTIIDTAGVRSTSDPVETEGVMRTRGVIGVSDLIVHVADLSTPFDDEESELLRSLSGKRTLLVGNKADQDRAWSRPEAIEISVTTGTGLDCLRRQIVQHLGAETLAERPAITNVRHISLVRRADAALRRARQAADVDGESLPEEFVLADLQQAREALEEVTGRRTSDDLLQHIFSRFCIGK